MLRRSVQQITKKSHQSALSTVAREFTYFDNLEVKDGVAIIRLNGPGIFKKDIFK